MLKEEIIKMNSLLTKFTFTDELTDVIENCKGVFVPTSKAELYDMVFGPEHADVYDVVFDVPGKGQIKEADVVRCKNGASVNFAEDYMRRREPDCMRIADDKPTDKKRFADVYGYKFDKLRRETMDWFKTQELILMPFNSGGNQYGYGSMLVCPKQCAFFAFALAHLQGFVSAEETEGYKPRAIIYVAPPFRHTHFDGKQVVVHNRLDDCHEVFSYNLYPGPSAKKGVYSVLLDIGEQEGWTTCHTSAGRLITPYENELVIMHEGASGGGKTTLCNLIPRFYEVTDGRILIDGQDIRHVTLKSLRQDIGIVQQDVYLFSGTVAQNIAYGKPGATREEIVEAARLAGAERFILALKDGFDTYVGERGVKLSGGQKQRIAIARVFLKNPSILILDEATSALDNESEILVGQSLEKLAHGRTTLTIAHRLTTIKDYDRILVLGEEGIVEAGTHEQLLAKQGVYYRLWNQLPGEDTL